ncbi:hypothetical protein BUALT_Bualt07G0050900 [Buddleja alternifolia]|uniref:BHLH domain-containing protein n=1 Tax=Buddleja alternifolia TaxID=168488 RepID=A0AAV6X845_9LAMI|nr:hypothetical protein BUALT_Bualt07G0050900 [Buddleja alternifolia]
MDPPLVNEASFTAAANPSSYSLAGLLSFPASGGGGLGLKIGSFGGGGGDGSLEESTVTEQRGSRGGGKRRRDIGNSIDNSIIANHDLIDSNIKRTKAFGSTDENGELKTDAEANSGTSIKAIEEKSKPEPPKDYIHVRARRGQATDSHSLAERARREKISERMKILQDLVPGCNKFLSMKLEAVNSRLNPSIKGFPTKDLATPTFEANGMIYGSQTPREYAQETQVEWLHMQVGSGFERAT